MNKLSNDTIKYISSAQVISSIFAAVKELIENALDAKATSLEIKLEHFGLTRIEVQDNGIGVSREQAEVMAKSHYTSKLRSHDDLAFLTTYGFRGEALFSLGTASELSVFSRTEQDDVGSHYCFDCKGDVISAKPAPREVGTTIIVKNIFKKLPVRRQYYENKRKCKEELRRIEELLVEFSLVNPALRIVLKHDKHLIWQKATALNLKETLVALFGSKVLDNLHNLDVLFSEEDRITKLSGFMKLCSSSSQPQSTECKIYINVNGRPVTYKRVNKHIKAHMKNAEKWALSLAVISISVPPRFVDVNVEPNKTTVLLENMDEILQLLTKAIDDIIQQNMPRKVMASDVSQDKDKESGIAEMCPDTSINLFPENSVVEHSSGDMVNKQTCHANVEPSSDLSETLDQRSMPKGTSCRTSTQKDAEQTTGLSQSKLDFPTTTKTIESYDSPDRNRSEFRGVLNENPACPNNFSTPEFFSSDSNEKNLTKNSNIECSNAKLTLRFRDESDPSDVPLEIRNSSEENDRRMTAFFSTQSNTLTIEESLKPNLCTEGKDLVQKENHLPVIIDDDRDDGIWSDLEIEKALLDDASDIQSEKKIDDGPLNASSLSQITLDDWSRGTAFKKLNSEQTKKNDERKKDQKIKSPPNKRTPALPSKTVKFSMENIQNLINLTQQSELSSQPVDSSRVIGQLHDSTIWIFKAGKRLFFFSPYRAQEMLMYKNLVEYHSLPMETLATPITLSEGLLGKEEHAQLSQLDVDYRVSELGKYISDGRLKDNGFDIRVRVGHDSSAVSMDIVKMNQTIPFFGIRDLAEILQVMVSGCQSSSLKDFRPIKVLNHLKSEAARIARSCSTFSLSGQIQEIVDQVMCDAELGLEGKCFHGKRIFNPLNNEDK